MKMRLAPKKVKGAKAKVSPYEIRDVDIPGLLLRVQPSGVKTFYVELARGVRVKLGRYPVMTVEAARTQAKVKLGEFALTGERPKPKHKAKPDTFGGFLTDHYAPWFIAERKTGERNIALLRQQFAGLLDKPLADVTAWAIEKHKASRLKAGIKPATVNRDLVRIKAALAKAVEWGLLAQHPLAKVKRAKGEDNSRVRYLSDAEGKALRVALRERDLAASESRDRANTWRANRCLECLPTIHATDYSDHLTPAVLLSMNTGLRRGELVQLTWNDVNLPDRMLTVQAGYSKSSKARHIPLNDESESVLRQWKQQAGGKGRLFPIRDAKTAWRNLLAEAGITNFRWHDMRHDFASRLVMRGVDLYVVKELLGHSTITLTERYAHLRPSHLADAVARLGTA